MFIGQHYMGIADQELGMTDLTVGTAHWKELDRVECLGVEFDGVGRAVDDQIRVSPRDSRQGLL